MGRKKTIVNITGTVGSVSIGDGSSSTGSVATSGSSTPTQTPTDPAPGAAASKAPGTVSEADIPARQRPEGRLSDDELRVAARRLLEDATPPSMLPLFGNPPPGATAAIQELGRQLRRARNRDNQTRTIFELAASEQGRRLIIAPRGSGKSLALWQVANTMLAEDSTVPVFLPLGRFGSWAEVAVHIKLFVSNLESLFGDGRVVIFLDGWSEFAGGIGGDSSAHRMVLAAIGDRPIVASARYGSEHDARFQIWHMDPLPGDAVRQALRVAFPHAEPPADARLELLQLPLAFVLHVLLGGPATRTGEVLAQFQQKICGNSPAALTTVLARAAARTALVSKTPRRVTFDAELRRAGTEVGLTDPVELVRRLGTFEANAVDIRPIHDLYWSWLVGVGLLEAQLLEPALTRLDLREAIDLAIESGSYVSPEAVNEVRPRDAELAVRLSRASAQQDDALDGQVQAMLNDLRVAVRVRGTLVALQSSSPLLFRAALRELTNIIEAGIGVIALATNLNIEVLWQQRAELSAWAGARGTSGVLEAIAFRGDARWSEWLERLVTSERLTIKTAAPVAIACSQTVPAWTMPYLNTLGREAYELRHAAKRGTNRALARWVAREYQSLLASGASFLELNDILVQCGDDAIFGELLQRSETLDERAQESLGYAVAKRGEPWLSKFQRHVLSTGFVRQYHALFRQASTLIDDETARQWVEGGPTLLGWEVLVKRHGNDIVPELLARLPDSFSDLHHIPELKALAFLDNAPEELVGELWKRISGAINEAVWEDLFHALAKVRAGGIPSVIPRLCANPLLLQPLSFSCFLVHLAKWESKSGRLIRVRDGVTDRRFSEWIRLVRWGWEKDRPLVGHRLGAGNLPLPISDDVLDAWAAGEASFTKFVRLSAPLDRYHAKAVDFVLTQPSGIGNLFTLWGGVLATFPEAVLLRILAQVETKSTDYHRLLRALAASNDPSHRGFHGALIRHFLSRNPLDVHASHVLASILAVHSASVLRSMLREAIGTDNGLWLLRDVEREAGVLLIDEEGQWLVA